MAKRKGKSYGRRTQQARGNPQQPARQQSEYRFLNPYNFVRYLDQPRPVNHVLGDCPPPPHDRYVGLTGRIVCEIEAVTPIFVSDSHAVTEKTEDVAKGHRTYRFFKYDDKPAIPASSLRGMFRSVFEAVTNSCFLIFQPDEHPLEHREPRAPDMVPARVLEVNGKGATLELLDCTLKAPSDISGRPTTTRAAAVRMAYPSRVGDSNKGRTFDRNQSSLPSPEFFGKRVAALVTRKPEIHRSGRFRSFWAEQVVPVSQHQSLRENERVKKVYGWLHVTGPNIENKHDERLFFRWDDTQPEPPQLNQIPKTYLLNCDGVVKEYNHHLKEYWERNGKIVKRLEMENKRWPQGTGDMPQPSTFIVEDERKRNLKKGDLVYVLRDARGQVTVIRSVSMPRMRYFYKRQQYLPHHLERCTKYDELCPACRVFGWVWADEPPKEEPRVAYAGRIRFSHALFKEEDIEDKPHTLAILSTPKPTTTFFYLLRSDGRPGEVSYDVPDARLRGRKVYRHFGNTFTWKEAAPRSPKEDARSDQNRTVRNVVKKGAKSTFQLDFENLAEAELGALLWTLELEEGMFHRLGFAKPLGLGSVKLTVKEILLLDPRARYQDLQTGWLDCSEKKALWVAAFKEALGNRYGCRFDQLANFRDLRALLTEPKMPHVHYPRSGEEPSAEGENFRWFVGNKRRRPEQGGPLKLPLAEQDTEGLPLLNERGEVPDVS